jgi:hypothetical protein
MSPEMEAAIVALAQKATEVLTVILDILNLELEDARGGS